MLSLIRFKVSNLMSGERPTQLENAAVFCCRRIIEIKWRGKAFSIDSSWEPLIFSENKALRKKRTLSLLTFSWILLGRDLHFLRQVLLFHRLDGKALEGEKKRIRMDHSPLKRILSNSKLLKSNKYWFQIFNINALKLFQVAGENRNINKKFQSHLSKTNS